jgi:hypothetical protein
MHTRISQASFHLNEPAKLLSFPIKHILQLTLHHMTRKRTLAWLASVFLLELLIATASVSAAGYFNGAPLHSRCHSLRPVYTDSGRLLGYRSVCEVNRWDGTAPEPGKFASGWSVGPEVFESRKHWDVGMTLLSDSSNSNSSASGYYQEQAPAFQSATHSNTMHDSDARQHAHRLHSHCVRRHQSLFSNLWTNLFGSSTSEPHHHHLHDPYEQLPVHEHCQPKSFYGGTSIFGSSRQQTIADPYTRHLLHKIHADRQRLVTNPSDALARAKLHHHLHKLTRHVDCHCHHQLPSSQHYHIHHVHGHSGGVGVLAVPHGAPQSMYPFATQIPLRNAEAEHLHSGSLGFDPDYDGHAAMMLRMGAHAAQQSHNQGFFSPNDVSSGYDRTVRMSVFHAAPYASANGPQSMYGMAATPLDDPLMSPPQTSYFQQPVPLVDDANAYYYGDASMDPYGSGYMEPDPQMAMYSQVMAAQAERSRQAILAYQQQLHMMQQQQMMQPSMAMSGSMMPMEPMGMGMDMGMGMGMGMGMMDEDHDSFHSHIHRHSHSHSHSYRHRHKHRHAHRHRHRKHLKKLLKPKLQVEKIIVIKRLEVPVKVPVPMPYPVPMASAASAAIPPSSAIMIDAGNPNALGAALLSGANEDVNVSHMATMTPGMIGHGTYLLDGSADNSAGALYQTITGMSCPCGMAANGGVHPSMAAGVAPLAAAAAIAPHPLHPKHHHKRHKGIHLGKGFKKFLNVAKEAALTGASMYAMTNPAAAMALQAATSSGALGHPEAGGANPLMMAAAMHSNPMLAAAALGAAGASGGAGAGAPGGAVNPLMLAAALKGNPALAAAAIGASAASSGSPGSESPTSALLSSTLGTLHSAAGTGALAAPAPLPDSASAAAPPPSPLSTAMAMLGKH